ncbi:hypothetical protein B0H11DRAFT_1922342 [Mycena galericulata]|nr:hypothetical protein B0H11DRAFT_1922342 [Mycena galericulata]
MPPLGLTSRTHPNSKAKSQSKSKAGASTQSNQPVIELDGDSDAAPDGSDSDIQEVAPLSALRNKVAQNKQAASKFRLTPKVDGDLDLPGRTKDFLKMREASRAGKRTDPKSSGVLFKATVVLQKEAGQKQGTRVPVQSRNFQFDDKMDFVFDKLVDLVNEPNGQWAKFYPGKTFTRDQIQFTFNKGMDIPLKYRTAECIVSTFWNKFTRQENQFFKKASIANHVADITMLVPIELTRDPEPEDSDDSDVFNAILNPKKRRKSRNSGSKKIRVKEEDTGTFPLTRIKAEPVDTDMLPTQKARAPSIRLTTPITFTKEFFSNSLDGPLATGKFQGFRDLCVKSTPVIGTYFHVGLSPFQFCCTDPNVYQLTSGREQFLARRLESVNFQFSPENELNAARAELIRGHQLKVLLEELTKSYSDVVPGLSEYSTPELFIATIHEPDKVLGHLVCQPKPSTPIHEIVQAEHEILNAISHFSFVQSKKNEVFVDFKGMDNLFLMVPPLSLPFTAQQGIQGWAMMDPRALTSSQPSIHAVSSANNLNSPPWVIDSQLPPFILSSISTLQ